MSQTRTYPRKHYTPAQRRWCERYERETTFEPLMCDYEAGNESFVAAARNSLAWFESWSCDAFLRASDGQIPGADIFNEDPAATPPSPASPTLPPMENQQ